MQHSRFRHDTSNVQWAFWSDDTPRQKFQSEGLFHRRDLFAQVQHVLLPVLGLLEPRTTVRECDLTAPTRRVYRDLKQHLIADIRGGELSDGLEQPRVKRPS